jgi:hypothetical protein
MLAELREEQGRITEAIAVLQRIAYSRGKRRGRPPSWMTAIRADSGGEADSAGAVKRRGRPPGSKNKPKSDER